MSQTAKRYTTAASEQALQCVAKALGERNMTPLVVDTPADARSAVLEMIPDGAEVHSGKSKTLEDAGLFSDFQDSGRYDFVRTRMFAMDRATQGREIRKLIAAPDYMVNSAQAITEDGVIAVASASASQIGPLASGAGRVIYVIGSQKIVPDVATAYARILDHVLPYEDARLFEAMGVHSFLARVLLVEREWQADRTTVVLVREPVGV
ncbi:MAG: LUD domain-containing protein [Candidatus Dormiibacterota bacterium]